MLMTRGLISPKPFCEYDLSEFGQMLRSYPVLGWFYYMVCTYSLREGFRWMACTFFSMGFPYHVVCKYVLLGWFYEIKCDKQYLPRPPCFWKHLVLLKLYGTVLWTTNVLRVRLRSPWP